jgi:hypothetical protein
VPSRPDVLPANPTGTGRCATAALRRTWELLPQPEAQIRRSGNGGMLAGQNTMPRRERDHLAGQLETAPATCGGSPSITPGCSDLNTLQGIARTGLRPRSALPGDPPASGGQYRQPACLMRSPISEARTVALAGPAALA